MSNEEIENKIRKSERKPLLEEVVEDSKIDISFVKRQFIPPMPSINNVSNKKNGVSINTSLSKVNFSKYISEEINAELPIQNEDDNNVSEYDLVKSPHKNLKPTKEHKSTPFSKIKYNDKGEEIPPSELRVYMKLLRSKSRNEENIENLNDVDDCVINNCSSDVENIFSLNQKESKDKKNGDSEVKQDRRSIEDEDNKEEGEDEEENEESEEESIDSEEDKEEDDEEEDKDKDKEEVEDKSINKGKSIEGILLNKDINSKKISEKTKSKDTNYTKNTVSKSKDLDNTIVNKDNLTDFEKYQEMFDNTEYLNTITDLNTNKNSFQQENNFDIEID